MQAAFLSPLGWICVKEESDSLIRLTFDSPSLHSPPESSLLKEAIRQLDAYFAGKLTTFSLPLCPKGTPFQLQVWEGLRTIPYGETISYAQLAERIGKPNACRAVGSANGKNPLPILIPCHRVIASDGSLGGYSAGSGIKEKLLALEGITPRLKIPV